MAEKLCLRWNDFQGNAKDAFGHLRDTTDFVNVTLACEDGRKIEAHKVSILPKDSQGKQTQSPADFYERDEV